MDKVREISQSDANNPLRKVQELREAMDHLHHKHAEPFGNKNQAQQAAIKSDFARYDEILRDIQAGVLEIIRQQHVKDHSKQIKLIKEKNQVDINIEKKTNAKKGRFNIKSLGRTDKAIMSIYQSQKRKELEVKRQKELDMKKEVDKKMQQEMLVQEIVRKEQQEHEEKMKVEIER